MNRLQSIFFGVLSLTILLSSWCYIFLDAVPKESTGYEEPVLEKLFIQSSGRTVLFSPYSFWQIGSVLWLGAEGVTQKELSRIAFPNGHDELDAVLLNEVQQRAHKYRESVSTAMGLFTCPKVLFRPQFVETIRTHFDHTDLITVPFDTDPKASVDAINDFIEKETAHRLHNVVSLDDITSTTVSALVATLCFDGEWQHPFEASKTAEKIFHSTLRGDVDCFMMEQNSTFQYYCTNDWVYVALPFQQKDDLESNVRFVFEAVLPQKENNSPSVKNFYTFIQEARLHAKESYMKLLLPKVSLRQRLDLKAVCKSLGITSMFQNRASFLNMSQVPLAVQKLFQEVQLQIYEAGVKVEAVTVASMRLTSVFPRVPDLTVQFDRPFFIIIRSEDNDIPILIAHISDVL